MTVLSRPFTAAIATRSRWAAIARLARCAVATSASIAPLGASSRVSRPRSATRRKPSSRENNPATHAATYSPRLCPITRSGSTPHDRHSSDRDHSNANSAGCISAASSSAGPFAGSCAASCEQHFQQGARKRGLQDFSAALQRLPKRPLCFVELASHAGVLRSLSSEQEGQLRTLRGASARGWRAQGAHRQALARDRGRRRDDGEPARKVGAAGVGSEAHIRERLGAGPRSRYAAYAFTSSARAASVRADRHIK